MWIPAFAGMTCIVTKVLDVLAGLGVPPPCFVAIFLCVVIHDDNSDFFFGYPLGVVLAGSASS